MALQLSLSASIEDLQVSSGAYVDAVYDVFVRDLISSRARWMPNGGEVSCRRQPEVEGRHAIFWHCVSAGDGDEEARLVDFNRCRRIHWIRPIINEFNTIYPDKGDGSLHWWVSGRRLQNLRYILATGDYGFVVMVDQRSTYAMLVTAYHVDRRRRREKFKSECEDYWSAHS